MLKKNSLTNFTFFPLFWLFICFAVGIWAAQKWPLAWPLWLGGALLCGFLAFKTARRKLGLICLLAAFVTAGGFCAQVEKENLPNDRLKRIFDERRIDSGEPLELEGVTDRLPEAAVGGVFVEIAGEKVFYKSVEQSVSGNVRLFLPLADERTAIEFAESDLRAGSRVRVAVRLFREDEYKNPGVISRREILDLQGLDAVGTIKSPLLVEKLGDDGRFSALSAVFEIRGKLIETFRKKFGVSTAGVLIASLLGNKHFLDRPTAKIFREGGTFHVLVISGLHITFIGGLVLLLCKFLTRRRFWQFFLASVFLWSFALAVGGEVPVVRAALMFTILIFSQVIYRKGNLLNALGLSGLVLLVWRPDDLFTASFQLTFVSVLAIVAIAFPLIENLRRIGEWQPTAETPFPPNVSNVLKRFCETLYWREDVWRIEAGRQIWSARLFKSPFGILFESKVGQTVGRYLFEGLSVSIIVQICLVPLSVYYFHRVSPISVLLNLWVGALIALESLAALTAVFFASINETLALPLMKLTEFLNFLLLFPTERFIENNWTSFRVPVYAGYLRAVYFLYFVPLAIFTWRTNRWRPFDLISRKISRNLKRLRLFAFSSFLIFFSLIVLHPFSAPSADGRLHVEFLDVGQGDAIFITFPNGRTMLADGGGRANFNEFYVRREGAEPEFFEPDARRIGEAVVSEYLWERGISKIDVLLATHADADHLQGLMDVAENFEIGAVWFGRVQFEDKDFADLWDVLQKRRIPSVKVGRGDVFNFGGVETQLLHPDLEKSAQTVSANNDSVVLRLEYGERSFLLTGDIEKETEKILVESGVLQSVDAIKVAHHGSRTSSTAEFISVNPAQLAVISVGRRSPFGHPHREVVERWQKFGASVLMTGDNGLISISTDGRDWQVKTFFDRPVR